MKPRDFCTCTRVLDTIDSEDVMASLGLEMHNLNCG